MKIILAGSTGSIGTIHPSSAFPNDGYTKILIGSVVLAQALLDPSITSIIILSRRPLPQTLPPKAKVLILTDKEFISYPPTVLAELADAEACIW